MVRIWVDADACPGPIRQILFRAAERRRVETVFVSNTHLRVPRSEHIRTVQVASGFDAADEHIVKSVSADDLVITADIPLAAQVVEAGAVALNPRGTLYTADTIPEHVARRDLMDELRSAGAVGGGPPAMSPSHVQAFADALDRYLTKHAG